MANTNRSELIPFSKPALLGSEAEFIANAIDGHKISGDGTFTKKCQSALEAKTCSKKVLLTTSCSSALEMTGLLLQIAPGDEVIVPSFTFSTSAAAFALRGANLVFVDIRPDTLNIDAATIRPAITSKTKVILVVHYAGVSCDMDPILDLAQEFGIAVVEDAAQALGSSYKGRPCGSMGEMGCFSFHETKNITCGEGGSLLINHEKFIEQAEIVWEKGTDRSRLFRGQVDKYTWVDLGSSYLMSDILAAYLYPQLQAMESINARRMEIWTQYYEFFKNYQPFIQLPKIPKECTHNAHIFYLIFQTLEQRTNFIKLMKEQNICAVFHYLPLHQSKAGKKYGIEGSPDGLPVTCRVADTLVRLPLFYNMTDEEVARVLTACKDVMATVMDD